MFIRRALPSDWPDIWQIIGPVIRAGDTYALDRDMSEGDVRVYWMGDDRETFVAEWEGCIAGTYYIRRNQAGGGSHVCNCGYITSGQFAGRGVARALCEHSLAHARERGYRAMQFNFVVATNDRAVALWSSLGVESIGRLPAAFNHPELGFVDALVMWRAL